MIANYTKQILGFDLDETTTEVADMNIEAALVANDVGKEQTLRAFAQLDKTSHVLSCAFSSIDVSDFVFTQCYSKPKYNITDIFWPQRATEKLPNSTQPAVSDSLHFNQPSYRLKRPHSHVGTASMDWTRRRGI